eukprot:Awhi_evm1s1095
MATQLQGQGQIVGSPQQAMAKEEGFGGEIHSPPQSPSSFEDGDDYDDDDDSISSSDMANSFGIRKRRSSLCPKKPRTRRTFAELSRDYVCTHADCSRRYASAHSLQQHIKRKHPNWKPNLTTMGINFPSSSSSSSPPRSNSLTPASSLPYPSTSFDDSASSETNINHKVPSSPIATTTTTTTYTTTTTSSSPSPSIPSLPTPTPTPCATPSVKFSAKTQQSKYPAPSVTNSTPSYTSTSPTHPGSNGMGPRDMLRHNQVFTHPSSQLLPSYSMHPGNRHIYPQQASSLSYSGSVYEEGKPSSNVYSNNNSFKLENASSTIPYNMPTDAEQQQQHAYYPSSYDSYNNNGPYVPNQPYQHPYYHHYQQQQQPRQHHYSYQPRDNNFADDSSASSPQSYSASDSETVPLSPTSSSSSFPRRNSLFSETGECVLALLAMKLESDTQVVQQMLPMASWEKVCQPIEAFN